MIPGMGESREWLAHGSHANSTTHRTISGIIAMKWWREQFSTGYTNSEGALDISPDQSAQIVSILSAGTFFGALGAAPFADHLGRRMSLIIAVIVFTIGVIMQTVS